MKTSWIDFKSLRARLDFEQILCHYKVEIKRKGKQHHGYCPLPNHNGKKNSPSFSADLERGLFHCFGCGSKGNLLEFSALMENVDPQNGSALKQVALKLQSLFCPERQCRPVREEPQRKQIAKPIQTEQKIAEVFINEPLDFELKGLDHDHPYLLKRGFTPEVMRYFGIGFCSRGMLKNRIAIPLHSQQGSLVGYAGRVVDDSTITAENPKYRFPGTRSKNENTFEFRKSFFVYNGFRIETPVDELIVVEGFTSVWWLHRNGIFNVVATMGANCSEEQADIIVSLVKPSGRIWIMPDGDEAGERLAESLLFRLTPNRFVRWLGIEKEKQPTDYSESQIRSLISK